MQATLQEAIRTHRVVAFDYAQHRWQVEPHRLIRTPDGGLWLLGWRCGGAGGWQRFDLSRIEGLRLVAAIFPGMREAQAGEPAEGDILCSIGP